MKTMIHNRKGFTLAEVIIAVGVYSLVIVGVLAMFSIVNRLTCAGNSQVQFLNKARLAQQKISQYIQKARSVDATTPFILDLTRPTTNGFVRACIYYTNLSTNVNLTASNYLVYVPDMDYPNIRTNICDYVRPVDGSTGIFDVLNMSPAAATIAFHIGDGTNAGDAAFSGTGIGYQGVEVRFSATPRNLQWWYSF